MSDPEFSMSSSRPYLLRALLDWILDNDGTPHIVVDATCAGVVVPEEHVRDGQVVLNIHPGAIQGFELNNELIAFNARFQGHSREIFVPMQAVSAIFARENGDGMAFAPDAALSSAPSRADVSVDSPAALGRSRSESPKRPGLKVVK